MVKYDNIRHCAMRKGCLRMDNQERRTLRGVFIAAGILAALALTVVVLYRTERRFRGLLYALEQRINPKSTPVKVELTEE